MDAIDAFLTGEAELSVVSSNVRSAVYNPQQGVLAVTYLNGKTYRYGSITVDEAASFARASSHGTWLWDNIRVRGSKTEHQKPVL
jgi:hypothetical protein